MGVRPGRKLGRRVAAATLALGLLGVIGGSDDVTAAVTLSSTCPVVGLGGLVAGDNAPPYVPGGAGGASALETTLSQPYGIAIDQNNGDTYVSERNWDTGTYDGVGRGRIRRITQSGSVTDLPLGPPGELLGHLAINLAGTTLFVATTHQSLGERVYAVDLTLPTPTWTVVAGGGTDFLVSGTPLPATTAKFFEIDDIEVSPLTGLLYISGVSQAAGPPLENIGIVGEVDGTGTIRTVVGGLTDVLGSNGEGVDANTARVPFGEVTVAFDGAGVMFLGAVRLVREIPPDPGTNPYGLGDITTIAGANGTEDVTGDGGPATAARFGEINALAADSAGNLYVGGSENHTVRRIDPVGNVLTYVGETGAATSDAGIAGFQDNGNASTSRLAYTEEMATYGSDVFVVDARNNRVRRVGLNQPVAGPSYVTTFAGRGPNMVDETGPALTRQTGSIQGVAVGPDGIVYLADRTGYRVWRRTPDGVLTVVAGTGAYRGLVGSVPLSGPATSVPLSIVRDVAVSPDNQTLYILERTRVLAVDLSTGILSLVAGTGVAGHADSASGPSATLDSGAAGSMAIGGGYLFISTVSAPATIPASSWVRRISLSSTAVDTPLTGLEGGILSLEADASGALFIGLSSHRIWYWDGSGPATPIAGDGVFGGSGDGQQASDLQVQVGSPSGLALLDRPGADDVLYFANKGRQIRSISAGSGSGAARWSSGIVHPVAGNNLSVPIAPGDWGDGRDLSADKTLARFNNIVDMDVDDQGRLFINDANFSDANPANEDATNTGPHMIRVLTDKGCSEAALGGPATVSNATSAAVPLANLPLGQIPFDTAVIAATPMRAVPMRASELDSSPMRASPMRAVPMRAIPMRASALAGTPMRASSLSSFPLDPVKYPGGWPERLKGTPFEGRLPQNIQLVELFDDPDTPLVDETSAALDRSPQVTLAAIDLASSPMRAISIASIALGSTPMRAVPMRASLINATDLERYQAWCDLLTDPAIPEISQLGYSCTPQPGKTSLDLTPDSPLLALDVASVPMRAVPMRAIPMRAVDISSSPMRAVPMRASGIEPNPMRASPMRAVPMRAVLAGGSPASNLGSAPMRAVPLSAIPMRASELLALNLANSPMRAVDLNLLGSNAVNVASCYPACQTLGAAADALAIVPTATLGDLIPALDAVLTSTGKVPTLGDLRWGSAVFAGIDRDGVPGITPGDEVNLGDVTPFLPEEPFISLADVLSGFIGAQDLPWEDISLDAMGVTGLASGTTATLPFSFRLYPGQASTVPLTVTLPAGWRYASTDQLTVTPDAGVATTPSTLAPTVSLDATTSVQTLTYVVPAGLAAPSTIAMNVLAHPGNRLGTIQASATIGPVIPNGVTRTFQSSPIAVVDPNDAASGSYPADNVPPDLDPDKLYVRYLNDPGETDYYRLDGGGAGAINRISLSHLPVDADLVVYEEDLSQFNFRDGVAKLRQQSKSVEMADPTGKRVGESLEPAELQDVPTEPGKVVASISAKRGTDSEFVELINDNPGVNYVIAVHGYNGASSPDPYVLRVQQLNPPGAGSCDPFTQFPFGAPFGGTTAISSVPTGTETLLLANRTRLALEYGASAASSLLADLNAFAARPDVHGAVVLVDGHEEVWNAYESWDESPCGLGRPNFVVRAINDQIDEILENSGAAASAGVKNIVIIGGDEQIPMARLIDNTKLSNEVEYGGELLRPEEVVGEGPISTPQTVAMASKSVLSDDPYASLAPKLFGLDVIYPPDLSIGRLVETPDEISGVLNQYASSGGRLTPDSALVTGYDFLSDGAERVRDGLAGAVATVDDDLIRNDWTAGQLAGKLVDPADPPKIGSINAHFDHHRLLPALGDSEPSADLFTTADLPTPPAPTSTGKLSGRVLFSMGCHSGAAAPDLYLGASGGDAVDWPQAFAQQQAIWVANSGFGYGDTEAVAYSERLMMLFATRLRDGRPAGEAMRLAKQDYLGGGIANSYDAKSLTQIIYYGLPMYRVGAGTPATPTPEYVSTTPDPSAGNLLSHAVTVTPILEPETSGDGTRYFDAEDPDEPGEPLALRQRTQVVDGRPIQPRVERNVTASGVEARGAVITALTMDTVENFDVTVARPVVDNTESEPAIPSTEMVYPSAFQNVTTFEGEAGTRNNLVLIPGQWLSNNDPTRPKRGTQRLFRSMSSTVYYAAPGDTDDIQPTISSTSGSASGGGVTFSAAITDRTPTGDGTIKRVSVMYLDGTEWRSTELTKTAEGKFTGGGEAAETEVDYFVQAVDASGNVAVSSNKARMYTSTAAPSPGPGINGAPTVSGPASGVGAVYQPLVFSGSFADGDGSTTWSGTVNNGAGDTRAIVVTGSGFVATLPPYNTVGSYVATVSICDSEGACGTDTVPVTVGGSGIGPTADCTVLSFGRAITWWGTLSSQAAPVTLPFGIANRFSPAPDSRGQPTVIEPGARPRTLATQSSAVSRLSWSLGGSSIDALAARGCGG